LTATLHTTIGDELTRKRHWEVYRMDPVTLLLALGAFGSVILIAIVLITLKRIVEWFRNRGTIKQTSKDVIAFTLADKIDNNQFVEITGVFDKSKSSTKLIQGFYDRNANTILDARAITSDKVEPEVVQAHVDGDGLVVYT
jgi:hypothetical protein